MIQNLKIENFRAFKKFEANGFERINLISGKNNSGKSCLLEAILCLNRSFSLDHISHVRRTQLYNLININADNNFVIITTKMSEDGTQFLRCEYRSNHKELESYESSSKLIVNFINQNIQTPDFNVVEEFDNFDASLLKEKLINILQIVDPRIEDIRTFKSKEGLWVKLKGKEYETIDNFGDATNNLIRYFTPIFRKRLTSSSQNECSVLLIDEIENGIHYTAHEEFWKKMFQLSKSENVQLFATTHSLEMIKAFNKVAKEEGDGAFFEMAREFETDNIFMEKHDVSLLEYELENEDATFRGE